MSKTNLREKSIDFLSSTVGADARKRELAPLTLGLIHLLSVGHIDMSRARENKWDLNAHLSTYSRIYDFDIVGVGLSQKNGVARFEVRLSSGESDILPLVLPPSFHGIQINYEFVHDIQMQ